MRNKSIMACIACLLLAFSTVQARENSADSVKNESAKVKEKSEKLQDRVWKRNKYLYLGYGMQKLENGTRELESDMAFSLVKGRTYYLHKRPIGRLLKFGLDWNLFDLNFAMYPDFPSSNTSANKSSTEDEEKEGFDSEIMQLEAGMGIGPSLTLNPVSHLKACLYFHVTPSYSMMLQNEEFYHNYATFFNVGLTLSFKVISLGVEHRWCGETSYDGVVMGQLDKLYDDNGVFQDPFEGVGKKMKTSTLRVTLGFRW